DDILDLSKFEAGKVTIELIDFSLHDLLRDILSSFRAPADDKSIALKLELAADVPERIATDETRLKQILYNLLGNSLKFSTQGTIRVRVFYQDRSKHTLQFEVEDDGIGISEERRDKLFQPFESLEFNRDHPLDGTGLGLVLSKRLAEALGGDLRLIHSQAGKGSCFGFTIRIAEAALTSSHDSKLVKETPLSWNLKGIRVLLAEDSPDGAVLVSRILSRAEVSVSIATNGFEVLELFKRQSFDLILMDVQMPGMDGLEATRVLRDSGVTIPILALTAHALPEERRRSFEAGCNAHLTKPIDKKALLAAVQQWTEKNGDESV
ncbi:MAG: response regulator, partial [Proteobacteria bacterium]